MTDRPQRTGRRSDADPAYALFLRGDADTVARAARLVRQTVDYRGYFIPADERPDVVGQTMLELYQAAARDEAPRYPFAAFVRLRAQSRCIDWVRARRADEGLDVEPRDQRSTPDRDVLRAERRRLLRRAVASLSEKCRELFALRFEVGLSYRTIAERRGSSEGATRVRMHECVSRVREQVRRLEASPAKER